MNEEFIDNIITNLKILSIIEINDKLGVRKGHLSIDNGSLQFIRRWFYRDSRDVIKIFIRDLVKNITIVFSKINSYEDSGWVLARILTELENIEKGLINLKTTYSDDQVMIVSIENFIIKFKELSIKGRSIVLP